MLSRLSLFVLLTCCVSAVRPVRDELSLLNEKKQLETVESMLRNYHTKWMKSANNRMNGLGPSVWVGATPPTVLPEDLEFLSRLNNITYDSLVKTSMFHQHKAHRLVRSRNEPLSDEICKTNRYWKQINDTRDIYGQDVRIVHSSEFRQFAFVYECINEGETCSGVSEHYQSTCEMRSGWANMLHVKQIESNSSPQWGYVSVPHHCACRIYPKVSPFGL